MTYTFKIIVVGDCAVGKSCLLLQYTTQRFEREHELTIGVEFGMKVIRLEDGKEVKLQIWDTAGQEAFRSITQAYYRGCCGALLVYDVTKRESFYHAKNWIRDIRHFSGYDEKEKDIPIILVANKIDRIKSDHAVTQQEGKLFANLYKLKFMETSAKTGQGVNDAFNKLAEQIMERIHSGHLQIDGVAITDLNIDPNAEDESRCC